jgi:hypothetical protein
MLLGAGEKTKVYELNGIMHTHKVVLDKIDEEMTYGNRC